MRIARSDYLTAESTKGNHMPEQDITGILEALNNLEELRAQKNLDHYAAIENSRRSNAGFEVPSIDETNKALDAERDRLLKMLEPHSESADSE
jgi:hypothetical protein